MKVIRFENPLPKEEVEHFDKLFNKQHHCNCGVIFETNVSDIDLHLMLDKITLIQTCDAKAGCPICHKRLRAGTYRFSKQVNY